MKWNRSLIVVVTITCFTWLMVGSTGCTFSQDEKDPSKDDADIVIDIMNSAGMNMFEEEFFTNRIGVSCNDKVRPLKVKFECKSTALNFLAKANNLKDDDCLGAPPPQTPRFFSPLLGGLRPPDPPFLLGGLRPPSPSFFFRLGSARIGSDRFGSVRIGSARIGFYFGWYNV